MKVLKIIGITFASTLVIEAALGVAYILKKPKLITQPNPIGSIANELVNQPADNNLINNIKDEVNNFIAPIDDRTKNEQTLDSMLCDPNNIENEQQILLIIKQMLIVSEEYTRDYESPKSQEGLRNRSNMLFDFIYYTDYKIRGVSFNDLHPSTKEQVKDAAFGIRFMLENGYVESKGENKGFFYEFGHSEFDIMKGLFKSNYGN